jgi:peptide/nickel transport system ATP-binding protein
MSAVPVPDPVIEERRERILLAGDLPSPANPPSGCRFHTRCPWRQETRCDDEVPVLRELGPGRLVSCHWAEEIRDGVLFPKSAEEVAATQGIFIDAPRVGAIETDALVQGVDSPIERR